MTMPIADGLGQPFVAGMAGENDLLRPGRPSERRGAGVVLAGSGVGVSAGASPNSVRTRAERMMPRPGWLAYISASAWRPKCVATTSPRGEIHDERISGQARSS